MQYRFLVLPAGTIIGLTFALLLGGFLLLGRHPSSVIFVSLGTLTGSYAADRLARRFDAGMRPQKITFGKMREMGLRGILVYCADYGCLRPARCGGSARFRESGKPRFALSK
ncbi:hypothetical protein ABIB94_008909 [Bradyrhizobium sp. JR7.2]